MSEHVVILHSLGLDGASYAGVAAALPGWRVHVPDLRGHGSAAARSPVTLRAMASDVVGLLDGLDAPVHLVGHSMGGAVAGLVADHAPELIASLTVVASPPRGFRFFAHRADAAERDGMAAQIGPTIERWFGGAPADPTVVEAAISCLERMDVAAWASAWRTFADFAGWNELHLPRELVERMLVVSTEHDLSTPPEAMDGIAVASGGAGAAARHVTLDAGGHLGLIEHPELFAPLLEEHWTVDSHAVLGRDHR